MNATKALSELLSNPDYFLKYYPLTIQAKGSAHVANQVNNTTCYLYKKSPDTVASVGGTIGHYGATRPGKIFSSHTHEISSFVLAETRFAGNVEQATVAALSIPMLKSDVQGFDERDLQPYLLDGSANIMITGLLSGCTFAWTQDGGGLWCTHIKPGFGQRAEIIHNSLNTSGRFRGKPRTSLSTFGRNDYPAYATVIGIRSKGNWNIYAQTAADRTGSGVTQTFKLGANGARTAL